MSSPLRIGLEGRNLTTIEQGYLSAFDSGVSRIGIHRREALAKLIRKRMFRAGDVIGLAADFEGVFASAIVIFKSFDGKVLHIASRGGGTLPPVNLASPEKVLGGNLVNISLIKGVDSKKPTDDDFTRAGLNSIRMGHLIKDTEDDEQLPADVVEFPRTRMLQMFPLTPVDFILNGSGGSELGNVLAFEKGIPFKFTLLEEIPGHKRPRMRELVVTGTLVSINPSGIILKDAAISSLDELVPLAHYAEVFDKRLGEIRIPWESSTSGKRTFIAQNHTVIGVNDITANFFDAPPERKKKVLTAIGKFKAQYGPTSDSEGTY